MSEIKVSVFKNIYETKGGVNVSIDRIIDDIRHKWEYEVLNLRSKQTKGERDELKKKLPYFTACGTFKTRKNSDIDKPSGLIAIDFDNIPSEEIDELKQQLCADQYSFAVFLSVSGTGICVLVKIDPAKHLDAFEGLQNYYFNKYEKAIDPACKDLSRSRTISFDPNIYHNPDSIKFKEYIVKPKKNTDLKIKGYLHLHDKFEKIVFAINSDICSSYMDWWRCAMALANHYGEAGYVYFQHISQFRQSSKKDFEKVTYQIYQHAVNYKDKSIDIGTFYFYIKQAGYEIKDSVSEFVAKTAYYAKVGHRKIDDTVAMIRKQEDIDLKVEEIELIVKTVFEDKTYNPALAREDETEASLFDDVITWLKTAYNLKKNEITKFIERDGVEQEEEDFNSIYIEAKKLFPKLSYENLFRIINSTHTPRYNPVKDYIESLEYDGGAHIKKIVQSITSDTGTLDWRVRMYERWLIGMIESIYGGRSVLMMVLAGDVQDAGKTEHFIRLLPEQLQRYFAESQLDEGKDSQLLMTQRLMILDDEYAGKSKQDSKRMKLLLSAKHFSLRAPYGKKNTDYKRLAILCGTSNDEDILNDPTGNRRIIVYNVTGVCDFELYNKVPKDQLIAEAYYLWKCKKTSKISQEDKDLMKKYTFEKHFQETVEAGMIIKMYEPSDSSGGKFMMTTEIKDAIEKASEQRLILNRLGAELKKLGFKRVYSAKKRCYGFYVKDKSGSFDEGEIQGNSGQIPDWLK